MCAEFTQGHPMEIERLLQASIIIKDILMNDFEKRYYPGQLAPILINGEVKSDTDKGSGQKKISPQDRGSVQIKDGEQDLFGRLNQSEISKNQETKIEKENSYILNSAEFSLIPEWWDPSKSDKKKKNGRPVFATHNARIETIDEKPAFRKSFMQRPCIVPIKSFFESSLFGHKFSGNRIRITPHLKDQVGVHAWAAGCYNEWLNQQTGELVPSFTIVTCDPSREIFEAGHDRMPIFLSAENAIKWLNKDYSQKSKQFLLEERIRNPEILIEVDRALKEGWQKNAPDESEIQELSQRIRGL